MVGHEIASSLRERPGCVAELERSRILIPDMEMHMKPLIQGSRRLPLASLILVALAGPTATSSVASAATSALDASGAWPTAPGATVRYYTNCDDDGLGSLRQTVLASASGDSVRASPTLSCSTITLQTPLLFGVNDLDIRGNGKGKPTITAAATLTDGLIRHLGFGQLNLQFLSLEGGRKYKSNAQAKGGCVYSTGNLGLNVVSVSGCMAKGVGFRQGVGGGVFSEGLTSLRLSEVSGNVASSSGGDYASGGGIYAVGGVTLDRSVIAGNATDTTSNSWGGGFTTAGGVDIVNSAIINNSAATSGGAHIHPPSATPISIINTTISGNSAIRVGGLTCVGTTTILSSTITNNSSYQGSSGGRIIGGGLDLGAGNHVIASTILTGNYSGGEGFATSINLSSSTGATLAGDHNHISGSTLALPNGTITTASQLLPLALNGSTRPTHALRPTDLDVDAGVAPVGQPYDQRGYPFLRSVGPGTDIGAYEYDPDYIFRDGFDAAFGGPPS